MQNIVNALGAGSGIDTLALVEQLVEVEKAPAQERLDGKREKFEAQISDYGLLRSALSTLQDAARLVADSETFNSKSASFTDSDALVPSTLDADTLPGDYAFEVTAIASAQSLSSTTFSDPTDAVGKGTLTFRFGEWDGGLTTFSVDASKNAQTITIDDSNNSLSGLANAINAADFGVQASVIQDGGTYQLLVTAPSGAKNQLEIVVAEDGGSPSDTDASDLSRFAFNEAGQQLSQNQAGADAEITVNGLTVNRESNIVDDLVDGFAFTLGKAAPGEIINVSIFEDKSAGETVVRDFIDAYNGFLEAIEPLIGFDAEQDNFGSLRNDPLAKSIPAEIRALIANPIPGLAADFTSLTNVGIRTELDGTLSINEAEFSEAVATNYDLVKGLFAPATASSSDLIIVNSFSDLTTPGNYDVVITADAAKGFLTGDAVAAGFPLDTTGKSYSFNITVDGTASELVTLSTGVYADADALAAEIQSQINADTTLQADGAEVDVVFDTDHFVITSRAFGSKSNVSISAADTDLATDLGLTTTAATTGGVDVAGTIDGVAGFGFGNILLPALNTDPSGLSLTVRPGATSATVDFSRGFGDELSRLVDNFLAGAGVIDTREVNINRDIEGLDEDQRTLDRRIEALQERLTAQFIAMESIVRSLQDSASFLESTLESLLNANNGN
ncbi:flagellar filament capping protein FliD [Exilibacterium tricleocarpae]|nr:flagellar filament capping protein FliD [Exilibacterium tricleocarpae]